VEERSDHQRGKELIRADQGCLTNTAAAADDDAERLLLCDDVTRDPLSVACITLPATAASRPLLTAISASYRHINPLFQH